MNSTTTPVSPLKKVRKVLANQTWLRSLVRVFVALGDNVRPIVQRPLIRGYILAEPFKKVFDAGCGTGMYTRVVLPTAEKVYALDYSEASVQKMRERYVTKYPTLEVFQGSADNVPLPDACVDLVLHCEVLEHIPDDRKTLSELFRVLEPGGRMVLSVPHPPAPIDDPNHVREGYTLEQLTALLNEAGFTVEKHRYCMFGVSKFLIKFEDRWYNTFHIPLPTLFYLPLYIELAISGNWGKEKGPYDVMVQARKPKVA